MAGPTPLGRISSRHQYGSQTIDVNHVSASVTADDADKQFDAAEMNDMLLDKLPMNRKTLHRWRLSNSVVTLYMNDSLSYHHPRLVQTHA
jgi:hypothetical protein